MKDDDRIPGNAENNLTQCEIGFIFILVTL